jgi:hypothetical protein
MAKLLNTSQQVYTSALYPLYAYSRIVSVQLVVNAAWGWVYVLTPVIGNNVWLFGVKVWVEPTVINAAQYVTFDVYAGSGVNVAAAQVMDWQRVLPKIDNTGILQHWRYCGGDNTFEWEMTQYFEGLNRRFALVGLRTGPQSLIIQTSFRICEG